MWRAVTHDGRTHDARVGPGGAYIARVILLKNGRGSQFLVIRNNDSWTTVARGTVYGRHRDALRVTLAVAREFVAADKAAKS